MTLMITMSWIGVMLIVGVILRAVIKPLGNILMPACVTGGIIGFILMNTGILTRLGVDFDLLNTIVTNLFTITFISMGLTATPKEEGVSSGKESVKGAMLEGFVWSSLYSTQAVVAFVTLLLVGGFFGMAPEYGLQIPFAFCQGPGQSATYGGMIEAGGLQPNAQQVGITFAVLGFVWAFVVGVPIAKKGLKHNLATYPREISEGIKKVSSNLATKRSILLVIRPPTAATSMRWHSALQWLVLVMRSPALCVQHSVRSLRPISSLHS